MKEVLNRDGLTEKEFLARYKPSDYERPSVTVDMLVFSMNERYDSLKLLLIKRNNHPYINTWALAGGFVNIDESAYQAACRELEEETGLTNVYLEQVYTMSQPNRDPRMRVIDIAYMALIQETDIQAGDDAYEALWFDITMDNKFLVLTNKENNIVIRYKLEEKIFKNGVVKVKGFVPILSEYTDSALAFDHAEVIIEGLNKLRNSLNTKDMAFNLVPTKFTLPDLQKVYEVILGKELYKSNFRALVASKIEYCEEKGTSITGGKKSYLYKYRG